MINLIRVYTVTEYQAVVKEYKRMRGIAGALKKENDWLRGRPVNVYKEQRLARMEERLSKKVAKVIEDNTSNYKEGQV